ncbi:transmembrane protein 252 [Oreochromis niloticus]|uniref:transmembrane protein 252 n=1 Tax=Oreochromis niloticus TaxID=8128 RepID=UPI00067422E6|nr:transmembrane protein 252 [Oreochromis niloticus]XP_039477007.1 transmembrane protein 252-like [Oreochromis aureus]CAI5650025.1 unnamed protein product [Mustela putorius furo]
MQQVTMNVKKQLLSLFCFLLPSVGLVLMCTGIYLLSQENVHEDALRVIFVYIMIGCGLLAMVIGVCWGLCSGIKTKRIGRERHIQVFTIERPSSFPPSYEESQESRVCPDASPEFMVIVDSTDMVMSLAPPLYSQDSSEAPDCRFSWEQPPPYSEVERIQQGQMDAEEPRERLSGH